MGTQFFSYGISNKERAFIREGQELLENMTSELKEKLPDVEVTFHGPRKNSEKE